MFENEIDVESLWMEICIDLKGKIWYTNKCIK